MGKYRILLAATLKKQKSSLIGIFMLLLIISLCMFSAITLYTNGERSVSAKMDMLGFGDFTAWTDDSENELKAQIEALPEVSKVDVQPLIFAGYEINGSYSDNDGQLIVYDGTVPYSFIDKNGQAISVSEIEVGTVYVSPALRSLFGVEIGDTVQFEFARSNGIRSLIVAGYFEDAFMGSSMIDMKSFLINSKDNTELLNSIAETSENDVLAKSGAMLHIFQDESSTLSESEFQKSVYSATELSLRTEFSYSRSSILSYMLLLQNILTGFLIAFSAVLFVICLIVVSHSLSAVIEQNKRDMAILKTIGLTGNTICRIYLILYGGTVLAGLLIGLVPSYFLSGMLAKGMVSSTGMLISSVFPIESIAVILFFLLAVFALFLYLRTRKILSISPMQTIREAGGSGKVSHTGIRKKTLVSDIALRDLLTGKKKYIGICLISVLLVLFLSVIGKMGTWLGANGEGLMNSFSVADHDLGVQPFNNDVPMDEIERIINWYSPIEETYELAMQSVTVNGQEFTANILNDTAWFHVLSGEVCDGNSVLITETVANELGVSIGDTVQIAGDGRMEVYTVSGIYACANGMGSNIGMSMAGYSKIGDITGFIWCYHYVLENGSVRDYAMQYLQDNYRGIDVHTNSWSGLDGIVTLMHILIGVIYLIAAVFILIAVFLTASKLLQSETGSMAIYKSMGIPSYKLRFSFTLRFFITVMIGSGFGVVISALIADPLISTVFRMFGIGDFSSGFGLLGTVIPPLAVLALFSLFAWLSSGKIRKISLVKLISENDD